MRLFLTVILILSACAGGASTDCDVGRWVEPGCAEGETPDFTAGCYVACETVGSTCPTGGTCTTLTENPCVCDAGEDCCDACGSQVNLCL
jgi:hypothetical protein